MWRAARYPFGEALATGNLGRSAARSGRFGPARRLLQEAMDQCERIGGGAFQLEIAARLCELDVFEDRHADALERVAETLSMLGSHDGTAMLRTFVYRVEGLALVQAGQRGRAGVALSASLDLARETGAPYEEALTLQAIALLEKCDGRAQASAAAAAEANAIFARLGVQQTPAIPLPTVATS